MDIRITPLVAQQDLRRDEGMPEKIWQDSSFNDLLLQTAITSNDTVKSVSLSFFSEISNFLLTADNPEDTQGKSYQEEDYFKEGMGKGICQQSNIPCSEIFNVTSVQDQAVPARFLDPLMIHDKTETITRPADSVSSQLITFPALEGVNKNCIISDFPCGFSSEKEVTFDFVNERSSSKADLSFNKASNSLPEGFHEQGDISISEQQLNSAINLFFNKNRGQDSLRNFLSIANGIKSSLNYLSTSSTLLRDNRVITSFKDRESLSRDIESDSMPELLSSAFIELSSGRPDKDIIRFSQDLNLRIEKIEKFTSHLEKDIHVIKVSLEPEGLGRLEISLNADKGMIKGYIHAFDLHSREVIERNLLNIISMLEREGINIGSLTVGLGREGRNGNGENERFNFSNRIEGHDELPFNPHYKGLKCEPLIKGLSIFV